jgi:hypothetical protein
MELTQDRVWLHESNEVTNSMENYHLLFVGLHKILVESVSS